MLRSGWALVFLAAVVVLTTADVLATGALTRWDRRLMLTDGGIVPTGWQFWVWRTVVWGGQYWLVSGMVGATALWTGWRRRQWRPPVVAVAYIAGVAFVLQSFKELVGRTFPGEGHDRLYVAGKLSYPSGHAAWAACCLIMLAALLTLDRSERAQANAMIATGAVAVVVATATVMLGYHWPTDSIGGLAFGGFFGLLGRYALLWSTKRGDRVVAARAEEATREIL